MKSRTMLVILAFATAIAGLTFFPVFASSHREAPGIARLPQVDGTDFYMFRSYEDGRGDFVTVGLPVLDGWEATRQLKVAPATRSIPIIVVSGQASLDDREKAISVGCDEYETKPIDFPQLLCKIRSLLGETATT